MRRWRLRRSLRVKRFLQTTQGNLPTSSSASHQLLSRTRHPNTSNINSKAELTIRLMPRQILNPTECLRTLRTLEPRAREIGERFGLRRISFRQPFSGAGLSGGSARPWPSCRLWIAAAAGCGDDVHVHDRLGCWLERMDRTPEGRCGRWVVDRINCGIVTQRGGR